MVRIATSSREPSVTMRSCSICAGFSASSVDRFLRRCESNETIRETVRSARALVEGFEAADPAIASAQAIARELRSGVDSESARPLGGYRLMFERLRDGCATAGATICLSTAVRRIAWGHGAVTVDRVCGSKHVHKGVHASQRRIPSPLSPDARHDRPLRRVVECSLFFMRASRKQYLAGGMRRLRPSS